MPACSHRRIGVRAILVLLLVTILLFQPIVSAAEPSGLQPAYEQEIDQRFGDELSRYSIEARFRPDDNRITGEMSVEFVNFTGEALDEIAFRLFPNGEYYHEGYLAITSAAVDGVTVEPAYEPGKTAMRLPLAQPLLPGESATIDLGFRTVIPTDSDGTFGVFSYQSATGIWTLADWYPILAGWDPDLGWRIEAPTPAGDPTYADAAYYNLTLTTPAGMQVISSGSATVEADLHGQQAVSIATGPARDLTMVIAPAYVPLTTTVNGSTISVWGNPDPASQEAAQWIADFSSGVLASYERRFGPYLYDELDLVPTPIQQAVLGVSWTGLIMLSSALFSDTAALIDQNPESAAFTIAHEMGHEWWGAMVGANSNDHPFMVEGLTNALTLDAIVDTLGPDAAVRLLHAQIADVYSNALANHGDGVVDTPVGMEQPGGPSRGALAYGKGALGFLAIRVAMGDDAFFAAIREYADTYLFANAEPDDLLAIFEQHAPAGVDVASIWETWFEQAVTTQADIDALVAAVTQRLYDEAALAFTS